MSTGAQLSPAPAAPRTVRATPPKRGASRLGRIIVQFAALALIDSTLLAIGLAIGIVVRWGAAFITKPLAFAPAAMQMYLVCGLCWLAMLAYEGLYSTGLRAADHTDRTIKALTGGLAVTILMSFASHRSNELSRGVLFFWYGANLLLFMLARPGLARTIQRLARRPQVLVISDSPTIAMAVCRALERSGYTGRVMPGDTDPALPGLRHAVAVVLCLSGSGSDNRRLSDWERHFPEIGIYPVVASLDSLGAHPVNLHGVQLFALEHPLDHPVNRACKRAMDLLGATALIAGLSPLLLGLSLAVKFSSRGPLFYRQRRLGRHGREFKILKFRSMQTDAEARLQDLLAADSEARAEYAATFKLKCDPRITVIGRVLRRYSLDELPQLWNVLVGDMSLVGPRPIVDAEVALYGNSYSLVSSVRPGMTGIWQTSGRSDVSYESRCRFDVAYIRNWSISRDAAVLLRTVSAVLLPNAY